MKIIICGAGRVGMSISEHLSNENKHNYNLNLPIKDARKIFEKKYLETQLNRFKGNIAKTSTFVGMDRSALHRKIKELDIKFGK